MNWLHVLISFGIIGGISFLLGLVHARRRKPGAGTVETACKNQWQSVFATLAEAENAIAFRFDSPSNALTFSSDLAVQLLGYSRSPLVEGLDFLYRSIHPMEKKNLISFFQELREGRRAETSVRLIRESGDYLWTFLMAVPRGESEAIGVVRNIHDFHKEREALEETRRAQTVSTMAGGVAHEFNNHLTPIRGFIDLTIDYLGSKHPMTEGLTTAARQVDYCSQLVGQIQSYGRSQVLSKREIDLGQFLPVTVNIAVSAHPDEASRIQVHRTWGPKAPAIFADPARLSEAITQIVHNAIRAMPDGGNLSVHCGVGHPTDHASLPLHTFIQIQDDGIGIPPEHKEQIFEPFFTTYPEEGGRGMGLSMVQGIIAQHDGRIEVQSEPNMGTSVTLWLPPREGEDISLSESGPIPEDDTLTVLPAASAGCMLVADDEEAICRLIQKTFEGDGWDVVTASDYFGVMKKVVQERQPFDILLLDITMPGPNADEAAEKILEIFPQIPILFISGFARDDRVETLLEQARAHFLPKPFSTQDLIERVDEILSAPPSSGS